MRSSWRSRSVGSRPLKADDSVIPDVLGFLAPPDTIRFVFHIIFLSSEAEDVPRDLGVTPLGMPPPDTLASSIKLQDVKIANGAFPRWARGRVATVGRGSTIYLGNHL